MQRPYQQESSVPKPPYPSSGPSYGGDYAVSRDEWNRALESESQDEREENGEGSPPRTDMIALLLLIPGVAFLLFGLAIMLFSRDGMLTLQWKQSFSLFYFIGAIPLLTLGWRALR